MSELLILLYRILNSTFFVIMKKTFLDRIYSKFIGILVKANITFSIVNYNERFINSIAKKIEVLSGIINIFFKFVVGCVSDE